MEEIETNVPQKELISKQLCMTKDIGINGNLFGGLMLSHMDIAGSVFAAEKIKSPSLVTKTMAKIEFKAPVKVGHIVYFYGEVVRIGNTSITVKISAVRHNVVTGKQKEVCETEMVFVKIDSDGEPCPIKNG